MFNRRKLGMVSEFRLFREIGGINEVWISYLIVAALLVLADTHISLSAPAEPHLAGVEPRREQPLPLLLLLP